MATTEIEFSGDRRVGAKERDECIEMRFHEEFGALLLRRTIFGR
jgi:hypothetical protein